MSKIKKTDEEVFDEESELTEIQPESFFEEAKKEKQVEKIYYKPVKWKGILDTFYCETCGLCNTDEESMILHVIRHVPQDERENLLDELLKKVKEK